VVRRTGFSPGLERRGIYLAPEFRSVAGDMHAQPRQIICRFLTLKAALPSTYRCFPLFKAHVVRRCMLKSSR
jgi:hypothetical protein